MNTFHRITIAAIATTLIAAATAFAGTGDNAVQMQSGLQWKDMGSGGVMSATVSGDMSKGPSRFFLKYPPGLVAPLHHHSTDHYGVIVSGSVTLTVDGKDHKLGPGDYLSLTNKKPHAAKVEGNEPVVFFLSADGAWDVVMEK